MRSCQSTLENPTIRVTPSRVAHFVDSTSLERLPSRMSPDYLPRHSTCKRSPWVSAASANAEAAPMGSPLSPALCLMVVSISEQIWSINFKQILSNHHLFIKHIRYVDNCLIFGDSRLKQLPPYEVLLDEGFYGKPIILETEPDQEFLGFMLETQPLELIYTGPTNISQVLSPYSASPPKVLLSGFRSRCHIVVKGAFPEFRVQQGLDQLIHLYTLAGFPNEELQMISTQILTQHLNFQPHENRASLSRWFFTFCGFPFCCFTCYFLFFTTYFDVSLAQTRTPIHLRFKSISSGTTHLGTLPWP